MIIELDGPKTAFFTHKNQHWSYDLAVNHARTAVELVHQYARWRKLIEEQYPNHILVWRTRPTFKQYVSNDDDIWWELYYRYAIVEQSDI